MIRPITLLAFVAAAGSGLYLYQTKLTAQLLDRRINHTVDEIRAVRQQAALLTAEYTLLNDPQRLQKLSDQFLQLPPTAPTQFVTMVDLASRLPPVGPPPTPPAPPQEAPPTAAAPDAAPADAAIADAAPPAQATAPKPVPDRHPASEPAPAANLVAIAKPRAPSTEPRPAEPRTAHSASTADAQPHAYVAHLPPAAPHPAGVTPQLPARTAEVAMPRPPALRPTQAVSMLGMAWTTPGAATNAPGGNR
jgi:hypothetical protein